MEFVYKGVVKIEFPSIAKVVEPNEVFEAPDDFTANNVEPATAPTTTEPTVGE